MSVRRDTTNRMTLFRECAICGKKIVTTASSPWMRSMYNVDGKKQKICYFCSSTCYQASYKHKGWYDGKTAERKAKSEAKRDRKAQWAKYYGNPENRERVCARRRQRYRENREQEINDGKYYKERFKKIGYKRDVQPAKYETDKCFNITGE